MSVTENRKPEEKNAFWETIVVLFQALVLALVIRTALLQPFTIPSGSMMPTLLIGDYLLVNKFSYGYSRYSLPLVNPEWLTGRLFGSQPKRGDVVVFRFPPDPTIDYIKRVIGLPGDRIQVKNDILYINDKPVQRVADGAFTSDDEDTEGVGVQYGREYQSVPVFRETLDNGVSFDTLDITPTGEGDNTQVFTVPPKHYFMMGDNRDNSADSRFTVGYVPEENLVGRASFIIFSISNRTPFLEIWKWPANLRFERVFKAIK